MDNTFSNRETLVDISPPTSRIEAFSDGIIAIVVTIMVFDLKLPEMADNYSTRQFYVALLKLLPQFVSYTMSFLILFIYWVNHHHLFTIIEVSDRKLIWYNAHLLFWLTLIPLPTEFIGSHPFTPSATLLLAFILLMCSVAFYLMVTHVVVKSNLADDSVPDFTRKRLVKISLISSFLYAIAIALTFLSVYLAWAIFLLVPLIFLEPLKIISSKRKAKKNSSQHEAS